MATCLNCGKEADYCLCNACKETADLEALCQKIIHFRPGDGENPLWDRIAGEMAYEGNFRNVVFALADELPSPRREYWKIMSFSGTSANVQKDNRPWLYEIYRALKDANGLSKMEQNRVSGLILGALFMDYQYDDADVLASKLLEEEALPAQCLYNLADFYCKTRRYDAAEEIINTARIEYSTDQVAVLLGKIADSCCKYREKEAKGKPQYMPNPKENRDAVRKAYVDFLSSIGIDVELPDVLTSSGIIPKPIPKEQYPNPKEIRDTSFDTFVAYDLETTGFSPKIDSIIEIGAIKVCNGEVVETGEFTFQEFVRPYKKSIRDEITQLTGITREDVRNARQMWEVFPDFMSFVGDSVLVGFNNVKFDSLFLVRAGRYSNVIMENPQFDVMRYADNFRDKLGITEEKISLEMLGKKLEIENSEAHRALADAITTAKIYLRLKAALDKEETTVKLDELLSDLDNW